jgi:hypothetical protein
LGVNGKSALNLQTQSGHTSAVISWCEIYLKFLLLFCSIKASQSQCNSNICNTTFLNRSNFLQILLTCVIFERRDMTLSKFVSYFLVNPMTHYIWYCDIFDVCVEKMDIIKYFMVRLSLDGG